MNPFLASYEQDEIATNSFFSHVETDASEKS